MSPAAPRRRRYGRWFLFIVLCVIVGGTIYLRIHRHAFETPVEVAGHNAMFRVRNAFADFYAVKNGGRVLLFDAGVDTEGPALDALLHSVGATRDEVSDIFFTHGHGDHLGMAPLCRNARLHAGAADADFISGEKSPSLMAKPMSWILPPPKFKITDALNGRVEIHVGGDKAVVAIPFPGHTPGSYLYLYDNVLFVGDSLNYDGKQLTPAVRAFSTDPDENKKQITSLRASLSGAAVYTVCTGHGACTPAADTSRMIDEVMERSR